MKVSRPRSGRRSIWTLRLPKPVAIRAFATVGRWSAPTRKVSAPWEASVIPATGPASKREQSSTRTPRKRAIGRPERAGRSGTDHPQREGRELSGGLRVRVAPPFLVCPVEGADQASLDQRLLESETVPAADRPLEVRPPFPNPEHAGDTGRVVREVAVQLDVALICRPIGPRELTPDRDRLAVHPQQPLDREGGDGVGTVDRHVLFGPAARSQQIGGCRHRRGHGDRGRARHREG